jgi:long-chain acyl-CoA synthetase
MSKVWLTSYPKGVPAEIDMNRYASLVDVFDQSVQAFSERPAFANMGRKLTFSEVAYLSRDFAAYLQQELGLKKGDRLAVMMPNLLQYPIVVYGALLAGLIVVNVNPLYTARELKQQLTDSEAKTIVILENYAYVLTGIFNETTLKSVILTRVGDLLYFPRSWVTNFAVKYLKKMVPPYSLPGVVNFLRVLAIGQHRRLEPPTLGHEDIAFLQYTGGTTGVAKGAMLTHGNMVANLQQASAWFSTTLVEGKEVIITALPLYHIFSLTANFLVFMKFGGCNYLITNPRDMKGFVKQLRRVKFTCITGVNTLFNGLLNTPGFSRVDFTHLKLTLGGGMAVQPTVARRWKEVTRNTLVEAYGLTETAPAVCINPLDIEEYTSSIGLPISSTECSIQDEEGHILPLGEEGELCVRGPQVMKGYWKQSEETKIALSPQGWLRTGDIATMDQAGFVKIVDRKKDMIIVSGFNVYPNEIESVIAAHPGVVEAGAIGIPDSKSGEVVKVVVVKKDAQLTEEALLTYCKKQLAAYKVPRQVEFRKELPKTNVGKILRRKLRERVSACPNL